MHTTERRRGRYGPMSGQRATVTRTDGSEVTGRCWTGGNGTGIAVRTPIGVVLVGPYEVERVHRLGGR